MPVPPALTAEVSGDSQVLQIRRRCGSQVLVHRMHAGQRPYIHPIIAPDGNGVLTEDAPSHHPWQHGLYTGFNRVNDIGFWKDIPGDGTFDAVLARSPVIDGHSVRWELDNAWKAPDGITLISERQEWTLIDEGATYDLDLSWTLHAEVDVEIGQYLAGGLFLRMPYRAEIGGEAINSEGQRNATAETRRARWAAVAMPVEGRREWAGMAIMDHPANPAHPVTWRIDNELGVSPSRCIAETWSIPAGTVDRYRFRVHVFCAAADPAALDARWREFAG